MCLIVICPRERTGYILDSCQYTKTLEDYDIVKMAVAVVNKNSTSHAMTWTLATCNQQKSDWECGYYVSYWMHDFLWYRQYRFRMNLWNDSRPFAGVELDNFVELWMKLFVKNYLKLNLFHEPVDPAVQLVNPGSVGNAGNKCCPPQLVHVSNEKNEGTAMAPNPPQFSGISPPVPSPAPPLLPPPLPLPETQNQIQGNEKSHSLFPQICSKSAPWTPSNL
ncbi:hypothetical protein LXL04_021932 [Taraxacum kok-saghyz]